MADNNEEFNEVQEDLIEQLAELARQGKLTADDLKKLDKASGSQKSKMEQLGKATSTLAGGFINFTASVAQGNTELTSMKGLVSAAGEAFAGMLEAIPFVGKALAAAAKAMATATNFAIDRLQVSYDAFKELSEQGLIGARGIAGLREQFIRTGIPLEKFAKIIGKSSEDLAFFSGSALQGGKNLSYVLKMMQDGQGQQLRHLGFSIEEIGQTVVDFQKTNRQLGFRQTMSIQELTTASIKYGRELDLIAKLTGKQRKEIQANREQLMADDRFRAWMDSLPNAGDARRLKKNAMDYLGVLPKEFSTGMKDLLASGGVATTEASRRLVQQYGPDILKLSRMVREGQVDVAKARDMTIDIARKHANKFGEVVRRVGDIGVGARHAEQSMIVAMKKTTEAGTKDLKAAQDAQVHATDGTTAAITQAIQSLQRSQVNIDALATSTGFAQVAVQEFAKVLETVTGGIRQTILGLSDEELAREERVRKEQIQASRLGLIGKVEGKGTEAKLTFKDTDYMKFTERNFELLGEMQSLKRKHQNEEGKWIDENARRQHDALNKEWMQIQRKWDFIRSHRTVGSKGDVIEELKSVVPTRGRASARLTRSLVSALKQAGFSDNQIGNMTTEQLSFIKDVVSKHKSDLTTGRLPSGFVSELKPAKFETSLQALKESQEKSKAALSYVETAREGGFTSAEIKQIEKMNATLEAIAGILNRANAQRSDIHNEAIKQTRNIIQNNQ